MTDPADRDKDADDDLQASHDALYAVYWTRLRPLPGAVELLRACKARGLSVVLASSAAKQSRAPCRSRLRRAGVAAEQAVFVGDTVWDAQASQQAGVTCIGLLSGGIGRDELADAGAAEIYAGPGDLLDALPDSLLGRAAGRS